MSSSVVPATSAKSPFLSDAMYDRLKFLAQIVLPALGALYFALAALWGLPEADKVVGTIVAVDTFLGVALGFATKNYNASDAKYDGVLNVMDTEAAKVFSLELHSDPEVLEAKKDITLKVTPTP